VRPPTITAIAAVMASTSMAVVRTASADVETEAKMLDVRVV
jgi:hypothetical protein